MRIRVMITLTSVLFCFTIGARAQEIPAWLTKVIADEQAQFVMKYSYQGRDVFYVGVGCCDRFNPLYDENGVLICCPDGGFTGMGGGNCPKDFLRKNGDVIWHAPDFNNDFLEVLRNE